MSMAAAVRLILIGCVLSDLVFQPAAILFATTQLRNPDCATAPTCGNVAAVTKRTPLSVSQAAERTGISKRTLQYAITAGHLKAHKLPGATGAYIIDPRDLDRYAATR